MLCMFFCLLQLGKLKKNNIKCEHLHAFFYALCGNLDSFHWQTGRKGGYIYMGIRKNVSADWICQE